MSNSDMNNKINIVNSDVGSVHVNYHAENKGGVDLLHVGVLGFFIDLICYIIGTSKEKKEERYFKHKTYNPEKGTYYDSKCRERLYSDDSLVFTRRNSYGETEIEYQNGVVRNLAHEKCDSAPGTVTRLAGYEFHNRNHFFKTAIGYRYKDRRNGKIYVIRNLQYEKNYFNFYMDVETGKLVRPTDGQLRIEKEAKQQNKQSFDNEYFSLVMNYYNSHINDSELYRFYRNDNNSVEYFDKTIHSIARRRRDLV